MKEGEMLLALPLEGQIFRGPLCLPWAGLGQVKVSCLTLVFLVCGQNDIGQIEFNHPDFVD